MAGVLGGPINGGAYMKNKETCFKICHGSVDLNKLYAFKLKSHNKATLSPVQYCHPAGGGGGGGGKYIRGGGGMTGCIFCFQVEGPYNWNIMVCNILVMFLGC